MFDKIEELQAFIDLYKKGGFEDNVDFEYKLYRLLEIAVREVSPTHCYNCEN